MNLGIDGRTALVVGASRDSGNAVALELATEGCKVVRVSRSADSDVQADVLSVDFARTMRSALAGKDVDIIVHVVGGSMGIKERSASAEDYAEVWRLNLGAAIEINNAFVPSMLARGWGRIVHFSSNAVTRHIGYCPYASAKHAVEGYVRNAGRELAPGGVVMTAVRAGPIETAGRGLYRKTGAELDDFVEHYVPMKRWGRPDEIAGVVAFLCSARASYLAGAVWDVDGAMR